jgi:hypothetical protein
VRFWHSYLVFYGIAVYEGYRLSFRNVSAEEISRRISGGGGPGAVGGAPIRGRLSYRRDRLGESRLTRRNS